MNRFLLLLTFLVCCLLRLNAQVNEQDSLALVALYESTDGNNWTNNDNWLEGPVEIWHGVRIENSRIEGLFLQRNNLTGLLPVSFGDLSSLRYLDISNNELAGSIPNSFLSLMNLGYMRIENNDLTELPNLNGLEDLYSLQVGNNNFTLTELANNQLLFDDLDDYFPQNRFGDTQFYEPEPEDNITLTFDMGDPGNRHYQWYYNYEPLEGANEIDLNISNYSLDRNGAYFLRTSSTSLPGFHRDSEKVYLNSSPNTCDNPFTAKLGLNRNPAQNEFWFQYIADTDGPILIYSKNSDYDFWRNVGAYQQCEAYAISSVSYSSAKDNQDYLELYLTAGEEVFLKWQANEDQLSFDWYIEKPTETPEVQKQALVDLYEATDGASWVQNSNWLSDLPVASWHGINTDILGNVIKIRLYSNELQGDIPDVIGEFLYLQELELGSNNLTGQIPQIIGSLENLTSLGLDNNGLEGPIPAQLGNLDKLRWVDLSRNQLSGTVPVSINALDELDAFLLENNNLTGLPDFSSSSWNADLYVSNNNLDFGDLENNVDFLPFEWNYNPQSNFGEELLLTPSSGDQVQLMFSEGTAGTANIYQWYKDFIIIEGANDPNYLIDDYDPADAGTYLLKINNSLLPHLELASERIHVNVDENSCENPILISQGAHISPETDLWYKYVAEADETLLIYPVSPDWNTRLEISRDDCNGYRRSKTFRNGENKYYQHYLSAGDEILVRWTDTSLSGDLEWHLASPDPTPQGQLNALISLYESAEGPFWNLNHNWLTDHRVSTWSGVSVDPQGNIVGLSLSGYGLNGELTADIAGLSFLEHLNVSGNNLEGAIPSEIIELNNLVDLSISRNYFNSIPDLTAISSLDNLNLSHNMFDFEDLLPNMRLLQYAYQYAPQRLKLGNEEIIELAEGQYYAFDQGSVNTSGTEYQWFKDFEAVPNENGPIYEIPSYTSQDDGVYTVRAFHSELPELIILSEKIHLNREPNSCENPEVVIAGTHISPEPERWYAYTSNYNQTILIELETNDPSYSRVEADFYSNCVDGANLQSSISNNHQLEISLEAGEETLIRFFHDASVEGFRWTITESDQTNAAQRQVLVDLYNALNGDNWRKKDNWLSDREPAAWYGVGVDDQGNIVELDLWNNGLSGTLPETINLPYLRGLQLSRNDIEGVVPGEFEGLDAVRSISLRENKLSGLEYIDTDRDDLYISLSRNVIPFDQLEQNEHVLTDEYQYEEQLIAFGTESELTPDIGATLTLDPGFISGQSNRYQWYKNYEPIEGAVQKSLTIANYSTTDAGIYYVTAESGVLDDLEVDSEKYYLDTIANSCSNPQVVSIGEWINYEPNQWYLYTAEQDETIILKGPHTFSERSYSTTLNVHSSCDEDRIYTRSFLYDNERYYNVDLTEGESIYIQFGTNDLYARGSFVWEIIRPLPTPTNQRDALVELYNATGGDQWEHKEGWLTDEKVSRWYGIDVNPEGDVTSIVLTGNGLVNHLSSAPLDLPDLQQLILDHNQLTGALPDWIGNFTGLSVLSVSYNSFDEIDFTLPNQLSTDIYLRENLFEFTDLIGLAGFFDNRWEYSPQNTSVGVEKILDPSSGETVLIEQDPLTGDGIHYEWFRYNDLVLGTTTASWSVEDYTDDDRGYYYYVATHPDLPGLEITSERVYVGTVPNDCDSPMLAEKGLNIAHDLPYWSNYTAPKDESITISLEPEETFTRRILKVYDICSNDPFINRLFYNQDDFIRLDLSSGQEIIIEWENYYSSTPAGAFTWKLEESNDAPLGQKEALEALYDALGGNDWHVSTNWKTELPVYTWYGLETNKEGSVTEIELGYNNLIGVVPSDIGQLLELERLNLYGSKISGRLTEDVASLEKLVSINVSDNELSGIPDLSSISNLTYLRVAENKMLFSELEKNQSLLQEPNSYLGQTPTIGQESILTVENGSSLLLDDIELSGQNNTYQWYHNYEPISGATSDVFGIINYLDEDQGLYYLEVRNSLFPDLLFKSEKTYINQQPNGCTNATLATKGANFTPETGHWFQYTAGEDEVIFIHRQNSNYDFSARVEVKFDCGTDYIDQRKTYQPGNDDTDVLSVSLTDGQTVYINWTDRYGDRAFEWFIGTPGETSQDQLDALSDFYQSTDGDNWSNKTGWLTEQHPSTWHGLSTNLSGDITAIQISWNGLSGVLPASLSQLTKLRELSVANNKIGGSIDRSLFESTDLSQFYISTNAFTDLPDISDLDRYIWMNVSDNKLDFEDILPNIDRLSWSNNYAPQSPSIGQELILELDENTDLTLDQGTPGGEGVNYQWYKNYEEVVGATASSYAINNYSSTDQGVYFWKATHPDVPDLTIASEKIYLDTEPNSCSNPEVVAKGVNISPDFPYWFSYTATTSEIIFISSEIENSSQWASVSVYYDCDQEFSSQSRRFYFNEPNHLSLSLESGQTVYLHWDAEYTIESLTWHIEQPQPTPTEQIDLLVDFYNATGGDNWFDNTNWLSDNHPSSWRGVSTDLQGNVIGLSLHWNDLTGMLPSSLSGLEYLEFLALESNALVGTVPKSLSSLAHLSELHLSRNQIDSLPDLSANSNLFLTIGSNELWLDDLLANKAILNNPWQYRPQSLEVGERQILLPELGQQVQLSLDVEHFPASQYQWYKNAQQINGATNPVLSMTAYQESDKGIYHLLITNDDLPELEYKSAYIYVGEEPITCESPQIAQTGTNMTSPNLQWFSYTATTQEEIRIYIPIGQHDYYTDATIYSECQGTVLQNSRFYNSSEQYWLLQDLVEGQTIIINIQGQEGSGEFDWRLEKVGETPEDQRDILLDLYTMTNGQAWTDNSGWNTSTQVNAWYGVSTDDFGNVIGLNLANNGLSGLMPASIQGLVYLEQLYIEDNPSLCESSLAGYQQWVQSLARYDNSSTCQLSLDFLTFELDDPSQISSIFTELDSVGVSVACVDDFIFRPSFTVPQGVEVYLEETVQESGVSEVDFSVPVQYVLRNAAAEEAVWDVKVAELPRIRAVEVGVAADYSCISETGGAWIHSVSGDWGTVYGDFQSLFDIVWSEDDFATFFSTDQSIVDYPSGEYQLMLIERNTGCQVVQNIIVPDSASHFGLETTVLPQTDCLNPDGSIMIDKFLLFGYSPIQLPDPRFTIDWQHGGTSTELTGLEAGTYAVTITDTEAGCTFEKTIVVGSQTLSGTVQVSASANTNCEGANGSASASVDGSTDGYDFEWYAGGSTNGSIVSTSSDLSGRSGGTYTVKVSESGTDCYSTGSVSIPSNTVSLDLNPVATNNTSCNNPNGALEIASIEVNDEEQTSTSGYKMEWSLERSFDEVLSTRKSIDELSAGTYYVRISQSSTGCSSSIKSVKVEDELTLPVFDLAIVHNTTCTEVGNGSVNIIDLPAGHSVAWYMEDGSTPMPNASGSSVGELSAGSYLVSIASNSSGCKTQKSFVITDSPASILLTPAVVNNTNCENANGELGVVSITSNNMITDDFSDYTFEWSEDIAFSSVIATSAGLTGLSEGYYYVRAKSDTTMCESGVYTLSVESELVLPKLSLIANEDDKPTDESTGVLEVSVQQLTDEYEISWFSAATDELIGSTGRIENLASGFYKVVVQSPISGCLIEETFEVQEGEPDPKENHSISSEIPETIFIDQLPLQLVASSDQALSLQFDIASGEGQIEEGLLTTAEPGVIEIRIWSDGDEQTKAAEQIVELLVLGSYSLTGNVVNESEELLEAEVLLISEDGNVTHRFNTSQGQFAFADIRHGDYKLLAQLAQDDLKEYYNTYFDQELFWDDADLISLDEDQEIVLTVLSKPPPPPGTGVIRGQVVQSSEGSRIVVGRTLDGTPIADVNVFLIDRVTDDIIAQAVTDESGTFEMTEIPSGSYYLRLDVPGVELSGGLEADIEFDEADGELEISAAIGEGELEVEYAVVSGVEDVLKDISIYPNPARNILHIEDAKNRIEHIRILNLTGQVILQFDSLRDTSFDVSQLHSGLYLLSIQMTENEIVNFKIMIAK